MRELTEEEKVFLVDYCMKPENTRLALEIGQVYPKATRKDCILIPKGTR